MQLSEFLTELGENPQKAAELKEQPLNVLNAAGLSKKDQQILLDADPITIHNAISAAAPKSSTIVVLVIAA